MVTTHVVNSRTPCNIPLTTATWSGSAPIWHPAGIMASLSDLHLSWYGMCKSIPQENWAPDNLTQWDNCFTTRASCRNETEMKREEGDKKRNRRWAERGISWILTSCQPHNCQIVDISAHVWTAHKGVLQKRLEDWSLLNHPSKPPDDPIGQGTELNWTAAGSHLMMNHTFKTCL